MVNVLGGHRHTKGDVVTVQYFFESTLLDRNCCRFLMQVRDVELNMQGSCIK